MNVVIFLIKDNKTLKCSELTIAEQKNIMTELNKQALMSLGYRERTK